MNRARSAWTSGLLVAGLALAGCAGPSTPVPKATASVAWHDEQCRRYGVYCAPSAFAAVAASTPAGAADVTIVAHDRMFSVGAFSVPAGEAFDIAFENQDPFKEAIYIAPGADRPAAYTETDLAGSTAFRGDYITGPTSVTYHVAALPPGTYSYFCPVHQAMVGVITVQ